ncbi:hypothetical protein FQN54_007797 [Arachnomyces sp. PD_36]|nr:hypothetical protein FQN54_007797 [Arachnomyces sp. PD_36]
MVKTVTEFIYLRLKPDVRPEDPQNEGGNKFLEIAEAVKQQRGYQDSSWGRTAEVENDVVWVIDWDDSSCSVAINQALTTLCDPSKPTVNFHSTLIPPTASTITLNPTNEIIVLAFPSSYNTPEGKHAIESDLATFRKGMLQLPDGKAALSFSIGWLDRPEVVKHSGSPTGAALLNCLVIGWTGVENHMEVRESVEFTEGIAKVREKMLAPVEGLEMRHVAFQAI